MPRFDDLRVRLLQIRQLPSIRDEEHASFAAQTGLRSDQLLATSALTEPLSATLLDGIDALLIGGAGAFSVTETYAWTQRLIDLVHTAAAREVPTFGCCWGHQFLARAFGGDVVHDEDRAELGCHPVGLTEAGRQDPLLQHLPDPFLACMGHHDRVRSLPPEAVELATNPTAPNQAFRLGTLPIYGTQFHPELTADTLRQRLFTYRDHYPEHADDRAFEATLATVRPTPDADGLLRRFLETFAVR